MVKTADPKIEEKEFAKFLADSVEVAGQDNYLLQRDKAEERILRSIKSDNHHGGLRRIFVPFMLAFLSIIIVFGGINWLSSTNQQLIKQDIVPEDLLAEDLADIDALLTELDQLYQDTELFDQQIDSVSGQ